MIRACLAVAALVPITVVLIPIQWLSVWLRLPTRRLIPVFYHRIVCTLLGVKVRVIGARHPRHPLLIVANHCSWLDIPVITRLAPVVFVAKREVASWPLFGLLAKLQRSIFVDRTRLHSTAKVNAEIAERLAEGDPVVLFGEGTSSDGNRVLPFRTALIGAAHQALADAKHVSTVYIQPLSIAYIGLQGLPMGRQHRYVAAWYGALDLIPHLGRILRCGGIDVVVTWGEPLACDGADDRKSISKTLEATVRRLTAQALQRRSAVTT